MQRPGRSDAHLAPQEEARIEAETREYFEEMAPKRHSKPLRSDHSTIYTDAVVDADASIPELHRFQDLQAHSEVPLRYDESKPADEYTETEYYDDLNCIDKHHHTTGTGFIKMERSIDSNASWSEMASDVNAGDRHASSKANPATNDWIPSAPTETEIVASDKPLRSDN